MLELENAEIWTGNQAIAEAVIVSKPDIVAAYPITPSTAIVQALSDAYQDKRLIGEFIDVESEHAAMSAAIGASAAGARTFTATASQGLLYMMEMIYWAGYGRLPMTLCLVNRALAPGWNIWVDHQDAYSMRDAGWIQLFAKNNQEAYDLTIQSFKLSEDHDIYLPSAVNIDGFSLSHVAGQVNPISQKVVDDFLPKFEPLFSLDPKNPIAFGAMTLPDRYKALRKDLDDSMGRAISKFTRISAEFAEITGRNWGDLIEVYGEETGDVGIISMGTISEELEEAIDIMNSDGSKSFASIRIRSFRPFPKARLQGITKNYEMLIVLDRGFSFGSDPPLLSEVKNALFDMKRESKVKGVIIGIGGNQPSYHEIINEINKLVKEEI